MNGASIIGMSVALSGLVPYIGERRPFPVLQNAVALTSARFSPDDQSPKYFDTRKQLADALTSAAFPPCRTTLCVASQAASAIVRFRGAICYRQTRL